MYISNTSGIMTGRQKYTCSKKNLAQGIHSVHMDYDRTQIWTSRVRSWWQTVTQTHENETLIQESVYRAHQSEEQLDEAMYKTILVSVEFSENQG